MGIRSTGAAQKEAIRKDQAARLLALERLNRPHPITQAADVELMRVTGQTAEEVAMAMPAAGPILV